MTATPLISSFQQFVEYIPCPMPMPYPVPAQGPDETAKALISVVVGVFVGVVVGIGVEPLKLWVNGAWKRHQLRQQLYADAAVRLGHLRALLDISSSGGDHVRCRQEIRKLDLQGVAHLCEQDKTAYYQVGEAELFRRCYESIHQALQMEVAAEVCLRDIRRAVEEFERSMHATPAAKRRLARMRRRLSGQLRSRLAALETEREMQEQST